VSRRLLHTPTEPRRYFLVPDDETVPAGALAVRTWDGRADRLSEEVLARFEVDAASAAAHVDAGVERVLGPVRSGIRDLLGGGEDAGIGGDFARWLGVTPGEVMIDRDKRRQGRRTLLEKAGRLLRPGLTDTDVDEMEARLDRVGAAIAGEGQRLREAGDGLADRLEDSRPGVEAAVQDASEKLAQLGQTAMEELDRIGRRIAGTPEPAADPAPTPSADPPRDAPEPAPEDAVEIDPKGPR
jgi:hypothetical protein